MCHFNCYFRLVLHYGCFIIRKTEIHIFYTEYHIPFSVSACIYILTESCLNKQLYIDKQKENFIFLTLLPFYNLTLSIMPPYFSNLGSRIMQTSSRFPSMWLFHKLFEHPDIILKRGQNGWNHILHISYSLLNKWGKQFKKSQQWPKNNEKGQWISKIMAKSDGPSKDNQVVPQR